MYIWQQLMCRNQLKRCISCNKPLFEGYIEVGVIDIDCRYCGIKNVIEAIKVKEPRLSSQNGINLQEVRTSNRFVTTGK